MRVAPSAQARGVSEPDAKRRNPKTRPQVDDALRMDEAGPMSTRKRFSEDPEMRAVVARFVEELGPRLCAIREALDAQDAGRLRAIAHHIASNAPVAGWKPVGDAAKRLEDEIRMLEDDSDDDGLFDEMSLSAVTEMAEDLVTTCRRAMESRGEAR